jgi:hypothetical protein
VDWGGGLAQIGPFFLGAKFAYESLPFFVG